MHNLYSGTVQLVCGYCMNLISPSLDNAHSSSFMKNIIICCQNTNMRYPDHCTLTMDP